MRSPADAFRKADWNFSRFEDEILRRPCDAEAVAYSAVDYCISIVALRDWTETTAKRAARQQDEEYTGPDATDILAALSNEIRWQSSIEAIANTAKHGTYNDRGWERGIAMPSVFYPEPLREEYEACGDGLDVFRFVHKHRDVVWWDIGLKQQGDENATPGYEAFGDALDDWQGLLKRWGLAEDMA